MHINLRCEVAIEHSQLVNKLNRKRVSRSFNTYNHVLKQIVIKTRLKIDFITLEHF